jgi:hypothetical protein
MKRAGAQSTGQRHDHRAGIDGVACESWKLSEIDVRLCMMRQLSAKCRQTSEQWRGEVTMSPRHAIEMGEVIRCMATAENAAASRARKEGEGVADDLGGQSCTSEPRGGAADGWHHCAKPSCPEPGWPKILRQHC